MSAKELAAKRIKDIAARRKAAEGQYMGYVKEQSIKKKKGWNVKFGGFKW